MFSRRSLFRKCMNASVPGITKESYCLMKVLVAKEMEKRQSSDAVERVRIRQTRVKHPRIGYNAWIKTVNFTDLKR